MKQKLLNTWIKLVKRQPIEPSANGIQLFSIISRVTIITPTNKSKEENKNKNKKIQSTELIQLTLMY